MGWREEIPARVTDKKRPMLPFEPEPFPSLDSQQEKLKRKRAMGQWAWEEVRPELIMDIKLQGKTQPVKYDSQREYEAVSDRVGKSQFGCRLNDAAVWCIMKKFCAVLDRLFLGRDWASFPSDERTFVIAFVEADGEAVHIHALVLRPPSVQAKRPIPAWCIRQREQPYLSQRLTDMCRLKGICPHGNVKVQLVYDAAGIATYVTKDFEKDFFDRWNSERLILSSEFHRKPASATRTRVQSHQPCQGKLKLGTYRRTSLLSG